MLKVQSPVMLLHKRIPVSTAHYNVGNFNDSLYEQQKNRQSASQIQQSL